MNGMPILVKNPLASRPERLRPLRPIPERPLKQTLHAKYRCLSQANAIADLQGGRDEDGANGFLNKRIGALALQAGDLVCVTLKFRVAHC